MLWNVKVIVILITVWILESVSQKKKRLRELETREKIETTQTTALLKSARILGRILETGGDLLSLRPKWKTTS